MMEGLFQHELITSLTCPHCKTTSEKFETSNILGAHFARATHLSQILRKTTFADNVIHDRECDNCKTRHDTRQKVRLACAPEVLAIQLARFTSTNTKNDAEVKFNRFLSLGPFMERQTRTDYELSCVVHHSGTMNSGHYKAVAVGPNGQWEELNDRVVTSVKLSAARKPAKPWTPYVLFYHRQNCHGGAETR